MFAEQFAAFQALMSIGHRLELPETNFNGQLSLLGWSVSMFVRAWFDC